MTPLDEVPNLEAFRASYTRFLRADRILLTGHSHQAWPDTTRAALMQSFDDAALYVDDKWEEVVLPMLARVGAGILERLGFARSDAIAFGKSTHELVVRLLSCLPLRDRPRIVTTTSEFHSLSRQLRRLQEEGVDVVWVNAEPREGLADRLLAALTPGTRMLALSAVFFDDAFVVPRLGEIAARAVEIGAIALIDAYHAYNVVPVDWGPARDALFVTAGGYKYAAFGEGVCWLRIPAGCTLRPIYTGWFADFGALERPRGARASGEGGIRYADGGARFAGGTFDPSGLYRAEAALAHWDRFGLTVERLRAISLRQTRRILDRIEARGLGHRVRTPGDDARRGGFVTIEAGPAPELAARLRASGVFVDARGTTLRLGPAPYLTDDEIDAGTAAVLEALSPPAPEPG